jgi:hypothetical protein
LQSFAEKRVAGLGESGLWLWCGAREVRRRERKDVARVRSPCRL